MDSQAKLAQSLGTTVASIQTLERAGELAGRLAVIGGAGYLFQNNGGKGILLGGVDTADSGKVVVLGAGVAGEHVVEAASSIGASVTVFDLNQDRLEQIVSRYQNCTGKLSSEQAVADEVSGADLVKFDASLPPAIQLLGVGLQRECHYGEREQNTEENKG